MKQKNVDRKFSASPVLLKNRYCHMKSIFTFVLFFFAATASGQNLRFAFISDTHIGSPNGSAEEDLMRTVADINSRTDIDFIVITGDVTELGKDEEVRQAKRILDQLRVKYYIIPGNHDTGWSESGGLSFTSIFGSDRFHFKHGGVHFIGCASGPYVRMSDGHVPRDAMNWLQTQLKSIGSAEPIVFLNHYPLDNGLDNWYEVIDALKTRNTVLALCGHGHSNREVAAEGIPSAMGRSNLRAKDAEGGYNVVSLQNDTFYFTERKPLSKTEKLWKKIPFAQQAYAKGGYPRPDFSMNETSPVAAKWTYQSAANIISTPAATENLVVYGNQQGSLEAIDLNTGKKKWTLPLGAPIFSSPAAAAGKIVVGSTDGHVWCVSNTGKIIWKAKNEKAVLGSPLINENVVYVGTSANKFNAYDFSSGRLLWSYDSLKGPVVSTPVIADGKIIFGAWDTFLYCLDQQTGRLNWKWTNGSPVINYSPASCIPVISDSTVYVVAPDRYLTAIDLRSGATLWRTKEATVRESIGISADGQLIYGKTMQDTIVAFANNRTVADVRWKTHVGFGYEHVPSMLLERDGKIYFGTRNGVIYCMDKKTQTVLWRYKADNSMVNTVRLVGSDKVLAATMDGKVVLLQPRY